MVDGDTLDFGGTRVRLFGVDAPESKQTCTKQASAYQCGRRAGTFVLAPFTVEAGAYACECFMQGKWLNDCAILRSLLCD